MAINIPVGVFPCIVLVVLIWQHFNFSLIASQITTQTQQFQTKLFFDSREAIEKVVGPALEETRKLLVEKIQEVAKSREPEKLRPPGPPPPPIIDNELDPLAKFHEPYRFVDPVLFPNVTQGLRTTPATLEEFIGFWKLFENRDYECQDLRHEGADNHAGTEGAWATCYDTFARKKSKSDCRIFSFGINNDFSFEDRISEATKCRLEAFDPSMGVLNFRRNAFVSFWNWGIFDSYAELFHGYDVANNQPIKDAWKVNSLKGFMEAFGVGHLDFLKIDVEYYEWAVLDQALQDEVLEKVDVLMFEIHLDPDYDQIWAEMIRQSNMPVFEKQPEEEKKKELDKPLSTEPPVRYITQESIQHKRSIFERIRKLGFKQYWSHSNPYSYGTSIKNGKFNVYPYFSEKFPCCFELGFIRVP